MDKLIEHAALITLVVQKTLSVINNDILVLMSRIKDKASTCDVKKEVEKINDIQVNYTAAFFAFANMSVNSLRLQYLHKHKKKPNEVASEFIENLRVVINGIKFFADQFDPKTTSKTKELQTYRDVLHKLEFMSKEFRAYGGNEIWEDELVVIGGFDYDKDERRQTKQLIPYGKQHAKWMETIKSKYALLKKDGALSAPFLCELFVGHDHGSDCAKEMLNYLPKVMNMSLSEHFDHWVERCDAALPLSRQLDEAGTVIKSLGEYAGIEADFSGDKPLQRLKSLSEQVITCIKKIQSDNSQSVIESAEKVYDEFRAKKYDFMAEYKKAISDFAMIRDRLGILFERHKTIESILDKAGKLREVKLTGLSSSIKPFSSVKVKGESDILPAVAKIIDLNQQLAPQILEHERVYAEVATMLRSLLVEIGALVSPKNKSTCMRNCKLIADTLVRLQLLKSLVKSRFANADRKYIEEIHDAAKNLEDALSIGQVYTAENGLSQDELKSLASKVC